MSLPPASDDYIGEPQYPDPWTTRKPREGLRDTDAARIVSLSPDVCKTPIGSSTPPIPYPVVDYCGHDENYTPSVRFTSQKAMVMRSNTTHVHGDSPGTACGVKSGTVGKRCHPIEHADQVRAEGSHVIRHLDQFWMNDWNTKGEAIFVRDTKTYEAPKDDDPVPGSLLMTDWTEPLQLNAQYAMAAAQPAPAPAPQTPPPYNPAPTPFDPKKLPPAANDNDLKRKGQFGKRLITKGLLRGLLRGSARRIPLLGWIWPDSTAYPYMDEVPQDAFEEGLFREARELYDEGYDPEEINEVFLRERTRHRQEVAKRPKPLPQTKPVRVTERDEYRKKCEIDSYSKMRKICPLYGMQAHHIVPDWTLRYGSRNDSSSRIPNMPSLNEGMSICVIGNAAMQDTEHNEAHLGDSTVEAAGVGSVPPGTAKLSSVVPTSTAAMIAARPDCAEQIAAAAAKQFGGKDPNQLLRAIKDIGKNPLHPDTISALKSGAVHPWKKGGQ